MSKVVAKVVANDFFNVVRKDFLSKVVAKVVANDFLMLLEKISC